jgi:hypothetical protein
VEAVDDPLDGVALPRRSSRLALAALGMAAVTVAPAGAMIAATATGDAAGGTGVTVDGATMALASGDSVIGVRLIRFKPALLAVADVVGVVAADGADDCFATVDSTLSLSSRRRLRFAALSVARVVASTATADGAAAIEFACVSTSSWPVTRLAATAFDAVLVLIDAGVGAGAAGVEDFGTADVVGVVDFATKSVAASVVVAATFGLLTTISGLSDFFAGASVDVAAAVVESRAFVGTADDDVRGVERDRERERDAVRFDDEDEDVLDFLELPPLLELDCLSREDE